MSRPCLELGASEQASMLRALQQSLAAELIETHISCVLVGGGLAWKLKKVLQTAFLDQSTLQARQHACAEELRLNRRLAPELYLGVVAVTGSPLAPVLGGDGPLLDCAVQMRAFGQDALWERRAAHGGLQPADIDDLARQLADFHAGAAVAGPDGPCGQAQEVRAQVLQNVDELAPLLPGEGAMLSALRGWVEGKCREHQALMSQRLAQGWVRECHGDLHLGNVTSLDGRNLVFDGIEFSDALRWIDTVSDIAFMAMDLRAHALAPLAHRFVNAWLEATGDYGGLALLDFYLVHRALVRAKVSLLRAAQCGDADAAVAVEARAAAARYLALAQRACRPPRPMLLLTHGCSGSGKSTHTQRLLQRLGAVRVRSDVERRRLQAAEGGRYGAAMHAATYTRLAERAATVLRAGHPVIVDATFLRRADRDAMRRVAAELGVGCRILDFATGASLAVMRQRVRDRAARGGDVSEADEAVLDAQWRDIEALQPDELAIARACWPQPSAAATA